MIRNALLVLFLFSAITTSAVAQELQIYFIDVEGGQSTLIITPSHQSLLVDAGFPSDGGFESKPGDAHKARDASRVAAVASAAGLKQIDYLLITHFHGDHDGGVPELAQLIPIRTFVDHGGLAEPGTVAGTVEAFAAYAAVRARGKHIEVKPGDQLPLKGVRVTIVSSAGRTLASPLSGAGARNPGCNSKSILHRSVNPGAANFAEERIANLDESTSYWIQVTAKPDGSFRVKNGRSGLTKSYPPRQRLSSN
jgi:competence protein ComEC